MFLEDKKVYMEASDITFHSMSSDSEHSELKRLWCDLLEHSDHTYFQCWEWVSTWLEVLRKEQKSVEFVYATKNEKVVAAFFVTTKKGIENKIIFGKRGYVNSCGEEQCDSITIEHNRILISNSVNQEEVYQALIDQYFKWDELVFPAASGRSLIENFSYKGFNLYSQYQLNCYCIDFSQLQDKETGVLSLLSRNKRYQIRKAIRDLEKLGDLKISEPQNKDEAHNYLNELEKLHQNYWTEKGEPGAFSSIFFSKFHRKIIDNYFANGHLKILKLSCGDKTVGYFYYFAYQNEVHFYQSGINYLEFGENKPGIVFHLLACEHFYKQGYQIYDFLAGDDAYKKSFSTHNRKLHWLRLRKPLWRFSVEDAIRKCKSSLT